MKRLLLLILASSAFLQVQSQTHAPDPFRLIKVTDWIQAKNYYLLTLFEQNSSVNQLLKNDAELSKLAQKKIKSLNASINACKDLACFTDSVKFTDDEIKGVSARLSALCKPGSVLEQLVRTKLIPSYTYSLYKNVSTAQLLVKAWEEDADGINYTIDVYANGKKPNYPLIDSISFNVKAKRYTTLLGDLNATLVGEVKSTDLFFEPAMHAALLYLEINERHDAANYEPMTQTVNKAAIEHIKITDWKKYPYSVILIPGAGPDEPGVALSAEGMLRCRLAVQDYRAGKAPFLMPSGGKVHPYKTKYCEAEEMKIYMVNVLHVPAYAIIMEPHARHTTTNLRNAVRLMYRYGLPASRPGLIITNKSQTDGILAMASRCEKELRYVPYKLGKHLSDTEVEYYPLPDAFQINPYEPLDP